MAEARRGSEEGRHGPSSDRHATRDRCSGWPIRTASRRTSGYRARPKLYYPDVCVFDFDPSRDDEPDVLRAAALALRELLDELGLPSWVKTSGSKGFHIVVPLDGKRATSARSRGSRMPSGRCSSHATRSISRRSSARRIAAGRIYVDTGRNGYSATFAAPYAVRAKPGAPVSAPCTWEEVERGEVGPRTFTLRTMARRVEAVGDLWSDMRRRGRSLKRPMERLRRMRGRA